MNLVDESVKLIQDNEPPEGYHVAFSGGKDSVVIKELVIRSGVKHTSHFARTSIDPPELLDFIRGYHKDVIWHRPELTMYQLIVKEKMLPTRRIKFCCKNLKEHLGTDETVITGIRAKESPNRAKREETEEGNRGKSFVHPIFKWSENDVWNFIRNNNLPYCKLYDEGFLRIGCIGCPMHTYNQHLYEFDRWKQHKVAYLNTIQKLIDMGKFSDFDDREDVYEWWISGDSKRKHLAKKEQNKFEF